MNPRKYYADIRTKRDALAAQFAEDGSCYVVSTKAQNNGACAVKQNPCARRAPGQFSQSQGLRRISNARKSLRCLRVPCICCFLSGPSGQLVPLTCR